MAPEIILGKRPSIASRCLRVRLRRVLLLTGQLVFEADTPMKMLLQHVQAAPIPPSQRTELPIPEIDELVIACLQKDPDKRPQSAEMLLEMTCGCKTGDYWSSDLAKTWWQKHLPEFTGALTLDCSAETETRDAVLQ